MELTHAGTLEITTERLKLRRFLLSDAEDMFKNYASDERVTEFLPWRAYEDADGVKSYLEQIIPKYFEDNNYNWAIEYDDEVIGAIGASRFSEKNRSCEVGYCLGHNFWNMGIISEALSAVIKFLFGVVNVRRISVRHDAENPASGRVMAKCGMRQEGRQKEYYIRHDGTVSDSVIYGILKKEMNG